MISGILAGGIPGFRIELFCLHPRSGPLWLFVFCVGRCFVFCLGLFLVCFLLSVLCVSVFALECDKGFGLCIGPLPVYFWGHYSFGPCTSQLINLICNMLGNMLNDLAEAIRRWTEKKAASRVVVHSGTPNSSGAVAISRTARAAAMRLLQGRPQLRLQKSYQFQVLKTNPKEASFPCLSS